MRILITGGAGAGSLALARLWESAHEVVLCDVEDDIRATRDWRWQRVPPVLRNGLTNLEWVEAMRRLARHFDLIVPGIDEELRPLAMRMPKKLLLPDFDTVAVHLDKLASMRHLAKLDIPVPRTARLRPKKDTIVWPAFPCMVKPREGRGSRGVAVVHSEAEGMAHVTMMRQPAGDFITQELLVGQEYSVGVLASKRKGLKAVVPVRIDRKRGVTLRARTGDDREVVKLCEAIHKAAPFAGYINVQCIKEADGRVRPFEINPRVSTTTCLAVASGLDIIGAFYGGRPFPNGFTPRTMRRYYHTVFV